MEYSKKPESSLQGRVALVTGGVKRLGRAVALRLADEGADVIIHYRSSAPDAQSAVAEIEKLGRRGHAIAADLTSVTDIKRLFDEAAKEFGRLDILVNCAANFLPSSIVSTTEEIWDASLDTNLKAHFSARKRRRRCCGEHAGQSSILQTPAGCSGGLATLRTLFQKRES